MSNNDMDNLVRVMKQQIGCIHTAMPGIVVSFDAGTCLASVKPSLLFYVADKRKIEYPLITGVPVFMPHAGNAQITYPVRAGDKCLIVFSERSLDEWINKGSEDNHDPRQFDLTDAFCFVGMHPAQSISPENVELINNGTLVSLTPANTVNIVGDVNIKGNVNVQGNYTCSGTSKMAGTITCSGDVTAGGISVQGHTHTGVHGETSSAH